MTYGGLTHRISNTETVKDRAGNSKSTTTYYQWCGKTLCMAMDSSGAVTERYYPQGEQINGKNRYYATDKLGSAMQVVIHYWVSHVTMPTVKANWPWALSHALVKPRSDWRKRRTK